MGDQTKSTNTRGPSNEESWRITKQHNLHTLLTDIIISLVGCVIAVGFAVWVVANSSDTADIGMDGVIVSILGPLVWAGIAVSVWIAYVSVSHTTYQPSDR